MDREFWDSGFSKRIIRIVRDLILYFGVYFLAGQLDQISVYKDDLFVDIYLKQQKGVLPAIFINLALLFLVFAMR